MTARDRLIAFAHSRPDPPDGGMSVVAAAAGQVGRLLSFLDIAIRDFETAGDAWHILRERMDEVMRAGGEGSRRLSESEMQLYERQQVAHFELEYRMDAYFVFARIALDRIVVLTDLALPRTRTTIGKTHRKLEGNLDRRCHELGIEFPDDLRSRIKGLADAIPFRDHFVVHLKSLRALRAIGFTLDKTRVYAQIGWLNPKDTDEFVQSHDPREPPRGASRLR